MLKKSPYRIIQADLSYPWVPELYTKMHRECFPDCEDQKPFAELWFAWEGEEAVAFASLWPSRRVENAGYLARAGVLARARGKGLQKRLIKTRERQAKEKGWDIIFSDVEPGNFASLNNLYSCGYRAFMPSDPWQGKDVPWNYMRKIISEGVA